MPDIGFAVEHQSGLKVFCIVVLSKILNTNVYYKTAWFMEKKTVSFCTLGCRYNRGESAEIALEMERAGYKSAKSGESADVVVVNTCAVTAKSTAKSRNAIRNAKEENPLARLVATGCYSEISPIDVASVDGVDLVVGNADKFRIGEILNEGCDANSIIKKSQHPDVLDIHPFTRMERRTNAYLNVQSGCDEHCSFCLVRIARGRSRSANAFKVVNQVKRLVESGIKEVVLSGINLGDYRSDTGENLVELIWKILNKTSVERVRLSSINPNDVTDDLIKLLGCEERLCRHLHIPLQSGSDQILGKMKRPYNSSRFKNIVEQLVERVPGIGIGADVMVGFPYESEVDYAQTLDLLKSLPIMMLHVFVYSRRNGTEAATLNQLPPKHVAKKRSAELKKLSIEKRSDFCQNLVGQKMQVLVENIRNSDGGLKGFTDNYVSIVFDGGDDLHNKIVPIRLIRERKGKLFGTLEP